jgi:hypothetical protein
MKSCVAFSLKPDCTMRMRRKPDASRSFWTRCATAKKPGRIKRVSRTGNGMTPQDRPASLPEAATFMREGVALEGLHASARALTASQAVGNAADGPAPALSPTCPQHSTRKPGISNQAAEYTGRFRNGSTRHRVADLRLLPGHTLLGNDCRGFGTLARGHDLRQSPGGVRSASCTKVDEADSSTPIGSRTDIQEQDNESKN